MRLCISFLFASLSSGRVAETVQLWLGLVTTSFIFPLLALVLPVCFGLRLGPSSLYAAGASWHWTLMTFGSSWQSLDPLHGWDLSWSRMEVVSGDCQSGRYVLQFVMEHSEPRKIRGSMRVLESKVAPFWFPLTSFWLVAHALLTCVDLIQILVRFHHLILSFVSDIFDGLASCGPVLVLCIFEPD